MVARFLERLDYVLKNKTNIGSIFNKFGGPMWPSYGSVPVDSSNSKQIEISFKPL